MSTNEIVIFGALAAFGAVCGLAWGCIAGCKGASATFAAIGAAATAIMASLLFISAWEAVISVTKYGYSLPRALLAGLATCFILSFSVPFISGLPAAVMAATSQRTVVGAKRFLAQQRTPDEPPSADA